MLVGPVIISNWTLPLTLINLLVIVPSLTTSHAAIHVWDAENPAMFQFDIYSCKDYDPSVVLNHIDKWFGLKEAYWSFIDRNEDTFVELKNGKWIK